MRGVDYQGGLERTRRLTSALGIEGIVESGGPVWGAKKHIFLMRSAGYVHPSRWECHSGALMECLALGVPAVVSERILVAPMLHRTRAAIVSPLEPEPLGNALVTLLRSEAQAFGSRGRELVASNFTWPESVSRFMDSLTARVDAGDRERVA